MPVSASPSRTALSRQQRSHTKQRKKPYSNSHMRSKRERSKTIVRGRLEDGCKSLEDLKGKAEKRRTVDSHACQIHCTSVHFDNEAGAWPQSEVGDEFADGLAHFLGSPWPSRCFGPGAAWPLDEKRDGSRCCQRLLDTSGAKRGGSVCLTTSVG